MVYLVITVESGRGTTDPPPGEYVHPQGATVTVKAIPDVGYVFDEFFLKNTARGTYYTKENPCTIEIPTGVSETLTVYCETYFKEAPPSPDVKLAGYRWEVEPGATFPYKPEDIRQGYRLYLTVRNEGGPGHYSVKVYLRNAPEYVWWGATEPELMWGSGVRPIDGGSEQTISAVLPEPKGLEYYETKVTTVETGVERLYRLEFPVPTKPPEEKPAGASPLWILPVLAAPLFLAWLERRR